MYQAQLYTQTITDLFVQKRSWQAPSPRRALLAFSALVSRTVVIVRFSVDYDTGGKVVSLWSVDGLERDNYDLVDWPTLFHRVGLPTDQGPDVKALAALR